MKKYVFIILVIVIIVLIVVGLVFYFLIKKPGSPANEEGQIPEGPAIISHSDEDWGFEINYPDNWTERDSLRREGMLSFAITAPIEDKSGGPAASFFVLAFNPEPGQVFDVVMENSIKQLQTAGILISSSKKTIAGYPAFELVYLDMPENAENKQLHYFIAKGDTWYQLLYKAKQDKFDQYLPEVEKMIESFRITK